MEIDSVKLEKALRLEPGAVYAIECSGTLSMNAVRLLRAQLNEQEDRLGVKFIVLNGGLTIAREKPE